MNGSNSLEETDRAPLRACSQCQQKIYYSIKPNMDKRLLALLAFMQQNNFTDDYLLLNKDKEIWMHQ